MYAVHLVVNVLTGNEEKTTKVNSTSCFYLVTLLNYFFSSVLWLKIFLSIGLTGIKVMLVERGKNHIVSAL